MKKAIRKFMSFLIALAMTVTCVGQGFASQDTDGQPGATETTESVTLHKILQTKESLNATKDGKDVFPGTTGINGTEYNGNEITDLAGYFGQNSKEIAGVYFAFKYKDGANVGKFVTTDEKGHYGAVDSLDTKPAEGYKLLAGLTTANGLKFKTTGLKGKFEIVEVLEKSTYKSDDGKVLSGSKAVPVLITLPLVNESGVVVNAHVYPKNIEDKPQIDKNFKFENADQYTKLQKEDKNPVISPEAGAVYENYTKEKARISAEIGKEIPYEVKTQIPKDAKYKKLVWNDSMGKGLTFKNDLVIKLGDTALVKDTEYKIIAGSTGFRLSLTETGLTKVEEAAKNNAVDITLTYHATLNKEAVVDKPEKNKVTLDYSNTPGKDSEPKEGNPVNKEIKVVKDWAVDGNAVTDADKTVEARFVLEVKDGETWKYVKEHTVTLADHFEHKFTNLDNDKTYRVVEYVSGYEPDYVSFENGTVTIKDDKNSKNPTPLKPTVPEVETHGKKFVKADENSGVRLEGAEFVVKNEGGKYLALKDTVAADKTDLDNALKAYTDAIKAWNDAVEANNKLADGEKKGDDAIVVTIGTEQVTGKTAVEAKIVELKNAYFTAFEKAKNAYTWVESKDSAIKLISDKDGKFEIRGLKKGQYKIEETKAPNGYALPTNAVFVFTVDYGSIDAGEVPYEGSTPLKATYEENETKDAQRVDNKLVSIPQTGGIGSIIFVVVGLMLMVLAGYKIKANKEEVR